MQTMNPQRKAFLDLIAWSEIGPDLLKKSDNGYNVLVGSTAKKPLLFTDYSKHPQSFDAKMNSDAAGRYQFLGRYWSHYKFMLGLKDFGPSSQDAWALQLIAECKAFDAIDKGDVATAVALCRSRWASFPGAGYGQRENKVADLVVAFESAGGVV